VSDFIFPGPSKIMRGKTAVSLQSSLTLVEHCRETRSVFGLFVTDLTFAECEPCASGGKMFALYDTKSDLASASDFYSRNTSTYEISFEISKSLTYRRVAVKTLTTGGGVFFGFILTYCGLRDFGEIILAIIHFFVKQMCVPIYKRAKNIPTGFWYKENQVQPFQDSDSNVDIDSS
jgi:hypothetical protein